MDIEKIKNHWIEISYDDYKKEFFNLCTHEFTELWIDRIKELREWLKKMF